VQRERHHRAVHHRQWRATGLGCPLKNRRRCAGKGRDRGRLAVKCGACRRRWVVGRGCLHEPPPSRAGALKRDSEGRESSTTLLWGPSIIGDGAGGVPAAGAWPPPEPPRAGQSICERVGKWGLGFPRRPVWVVLTQRRTRWTVRFIPTVSSDRCRQKQALGCNEPGHRVSSTIYPLHRALCEKKALGRISFGPVIFYRNSFNCFLLSFLANL
jgi:hypothetical protein